MAQLFSAGDYFISPELFIDSINERGVEAGLASLTARTLTVSWPKEPFFSVEGVHEASGDVDDVIDGLRGAEFAATHHAPFPARVFQQSPELRFLGVCRGGPVNVDLGAATKAGVIVSYAPGRNAQAAAEYAVGLMLAAMRRIPEADSEMKRGVWRGDYFTYDETGQEIRGNTIGLIGYGAIGRIVAGILRGFGATVLAFDPHADTEKMAQEGVEPVELKSLLSRSNVVSLHARLTAETNHILNRETLTLLPRGAVLVNTARGGLLDYAPLPELLRSGQLGALALDVYDVEPPPADWPLFDAPNVTLSPHLGGATRQTAQRAATIVADEMTRFRSGQRPRFVANPEVLDQVEPLK